MTFQERVISAEAKLRAGYDPESENGAAVRSDSWCRALGWQDAIGEEALEAATLTPQAPEVKRRVHKLCDCGSGRLRPVGTAFCWICETRDSVFDDLDRELGHGKYKRVAVVAGAPE